MKYILDISIEFKRMVDQINPEAMEEIEESVLGLLICLLEKEPRPFSARIWRNLPIRTQIFFQDHFIGKGKDFKTLEEAFGNYFWVGDSNNFNWNIISVELARFLHNFPNAKRIGIFGNHRCLLSLGKKTRTKFRFQTNTRFRAPLYTLKFSGKFAGWVDQKRFNQNWHSYFFAKNTTLPNFLNVIQFQPYLKKRPKPFTIQLKQ